MVNFDDPKIAVLLQLLNEAAGSRAVTVIFDGEPGELEGALIEHNRLLTLASKPTPKTTSDVGEADFPKPGGNAAADRCGDASYVTSSGVASGFYGSGSCSTISNLDVQADELLTAPSQIAAIAAEIADIAKEKGIYASVSVSIMLDGRLEVEVPADVG